MQFRISAAVIVFVALASPGQAQGVKRQFNAGEVTLSAQNAPVRAILQEWARLGGATIVNADRVAGPPVTLELTGVPERQALDVVLRSVAGYIVAPRPQGSAGASAFDRILILPTSVAPRNPPPAVATAGARPPIVRPAPIIRPPDPNDNVTENADPLEDPSALRDAAANARGHRPGSGRRRWSAAGHAGRSRTDSGESFRRPIWIVADAGCHLTGSAHAAAGTETTDKPRTITSLKNTTPTQDTKKRLRALRTLRGLRVVYVRNRSLQTRRPPRRRYAVSPHPRTGRRRSKSPSLGLAASTQPVQPQW
jgi:hypothetical protein